MFSDFTINKLHDFIFTSKLSEVLIAKKRSVSLTGASDVIDAKKSIMRIIDIVHSTQSSKRIIDIVNYVEEKYSENFNNTIFEKRLKDFVKPYNYSFVKNDYISHIKLIGQIKSIDSQLWQLMKRVNSLVKKTKNSELEKISFNSLDMNKIKRYKGQKFLELIVNLIDLYQFKNLNTDHMKILKTSINNCIQSILYGA